MQLASIIEALRSLLKVNTYGSDLEKYIVSRNPQNPCDVEKLTRDYELSQVNERFL